MPSELSKNSQIEKRFFCLRGFMKSGTNWVCRLLNLHPDIDCIGEYHWEHFFETLEKTLTTIAEQRRDRMRTVVRKELEALVRRSLIEFAKPEAKLIGDRTPATIHPIVLREAPHICVIRDCRDVVVSRMFHLFNTPRVTRVFENFPNMAERLEKFKADPWFFRDNPNELLAHEGVVRRSARDWAAYMAADRNTIDKQPKLKVIQVQYESLHENVEAQRKKLYEFLEVDPNAAAEIPDPLQPGHKSEQPNNFMRKGAVGDWENYMTDQARQWINEEAGEELVRQGYTESAVW